MRIWRNWLERTMVDLPPSTRGSRSSTMTLQNSSRRTELTRLSLGQHVTVGSLCSVSHCRPRRFVPLLTGEGRLVGHRHLQFGCCLRGFGWISVAQLATPHPDAGEFHPDRPFLCAVSSLTVMLPNLGAVVGHRYRVVHAHTLGVQLGYCTSKWCGQRRHQLRAPRHHPERGQ